MRWLHYWICAICLTSLAMPLAVAQTTSKTANLQNRWREFRGPQGTGIATGATFPTQFTQADIQWQTPIHGKGWSSPVVANGKIWLTTATEDGREMSVICVDLKSGKKLLDRVLHKNRQPDFCHPTNSYASPTPVIDESGSFVFIHFGRYGTTCMDTESYKVIWQRTDLQCDHFRGPASSPILYRDLVIVAFDGADQQYVIALSQRDGTTVWKQARDIDYGTENGDLKKAYGTGSIFEVDGKPLLVYPSAAATIAYRPQSGKVVWIVYHQGMNTSSRPLKTKQGDLLISNGMGKLFAVDPAGVGDITADNIRWKMSKGVSKKPGPLVIGNHLFMINDQGIASWNATQNGSNIWLKRLGGAFSSSPVSDGESIFVCSEQGMVYAIKPGQTFQLAGQSKLAAGFKATPAIVGDQMIFRSFSKLFSIKAESGRSSEPSASNAKQER